MVSVCTVPARGGRSCEHLPEDLRALSVMVQGLMPHTEKSNKSVFNVYSTHV